MNRTDFHRFIRNPGAVDTGTLSDLKEVLQLFPWFQSAHMLLLRGLKNSDDVRFDTHLKESAAHIADREKLYYLITREIVSSTTFTEETIGVKTLADQLDPHTAGHTVEDAPTDNPSHNDLQSSAGFPVSQTQHSPVHTAETLSITPTNSSDTPAAVEANELLRSVTELRAEIEKRLNELGGGLLELETRSDVYSDESVMPQGNREVNGPAGILELDNGIDYTEGELPQSTDIDPPAHRDRQAQMELIDRFISLSPRLEVQKDRNPATEGDLSEPHTVAKVSFVSETLAHIYIDQGYYSRAIEIYEKLCLKYPEKSSYFADQIEKVKDLIKKA
jgi:hypothetical protein